MLYFILVLQSCIVKLEDISLLYALLVPSINKFTVSHNTYFNLSILLDLSSPILFSFHQAVYQVYHWFSLCINRNILLFSHCDIFFNFMKFYDFYLDCLSFHTLIYGKVLSLLTSLNHLNYHPHQAVVCENGSYTLCLSRCYSRVPSRLMSF